MNRIFNEIAWWASAHRVDWLWKLVYRYRCPYPIDEHNSVRACVRAGNCGCENGARFSAMPHPKGTE